MLSSMSQNLLFVNNNQQEFTEKKLSFAIYDNFKQSRIFSPLLPPPFRRLSGALCTLPKSGCSPSAGETAFYAVPHRCTAPAPLKNDRQLACTCIFQCVFAANPSKGRNVFSALFLGKNQFTTGRRCVYNRDSKYV